MASAVRAAVFGLARSIAALDPERSNAPNVAFSDVHMLAREFMDLYHEKVASSSFDQIELRKFALDQACKVSHAHSAAETSDWVIVNTYLFTALLLSKDDKHLLDRVTGAATKLESEDKYGPLHTLVLGPKV